MLCRKSDNHRKKPTLRFSPDFIADSVDTIDFTYLRSLGIKVCMVDLDGTVVARSQYDVSPAIRKNLAASGMKVYIATNRPKGRDLKNLVEDLGADGSVHPHGPFGKPTKRYFKQGIRDKGFEPHEAVMIGDRYIQDILGANRAGMYSLLVYKLDRPINFGDYLISGLEKRLTLHLAKNYVK